VVVVILRPSSRISKASESKPLLTLNTSSKCEKAGHDSCLPACLHFTTIVVAISTAAAMHTKKTAKTSPQIIRTTATSNTVFIMSHKTVPLRCSSKVRSSSHAIFKKSVQQRAAKKPARKVSSRDKKKKQSSTKTARD
jgi:hypothetical protein